MWFLFTIVWLQLLNWKVLWAESCWSDLEDQKNLLEKPFNHQTRERLIYLDMMTINILWRAKIRLQNNNVTVAYFFYYYWWNLNSNSPNQLLYFFKCTEVVLCIIIPYPPKNPSNKLFKDQNYDNHAYKELAMECFALYQYKSTKNKINIFFSHFLSLSPKL